MAQDVSPREKEAPLSNTFTVGCVQNCAGPDMDASLARSVELTRQARDLGAHLICLPEFFSCLDVARDRFEVGPYAEAEHPVLPVYRELAGELGAWILLGSIAVRSDEDKIRNRSILIDAAGAVVASYDKVHLFDVDLSEGECYRESNWVAPGDRAQVAPTPWGLMGLSVCYDLRFAYLYRALAQAGAIFLTIPAAFTKTTGQAHWHVLNRARAIETGSFVFAPGQSGVHGEGVTYGHSLIVDPWGRVLADGGEDEGVIIAEIDPARAEEARRMIPALKHDRPFADPDEKAMRAAG
jgi:predicted amidohydrolase